MKLRLSRIRSTLSSNESPRSSGAMGHRNGFTMLELVIVMTIIIILAAIGVANYQKLQLHARETILKADLRDMRRAIDQYTADKERLPASLDDLVNDGY